MSVRITTQGEAALYDSTTGIAFGPVFDITGDAEDFLEWLELVFPGRDARSLSAALAELKNDWEDERNERDGDKSDTEIYGAGV